MDTKFQKKHESDMTSKEKRELEREKLASMHGLEKVEYILAYYKLHIVAVIALIFAVIGIFIWVDDLKDENYIYVSVVDATTEGENFIEDFREFVGDEEEHHKYVLDTGIFQSTNFSGQKTLDQSANMKLTALVGSGELDVLICPESIYKLYSDEEEDGLYPISELMGEEFVAEHADVCIRDAILVEDNSVLEKYGLSIEEPAYLIVFRNSKHPEIAKELINFLMK